jgi:hydrogenase maturation protease
MASQSKKCIVVGIGNPLLTDERAGLEVVERLKSQNADVETATRYPAERDVLDVIMGYEQAVIVDACQLGLQPGTVLEVSPEEMLDRRTAASSHAGAWGDALKTGIECYPDQMPADIKIMLVEIEDVSTFSTQCTPVVSHAIGDVVSRIHASRPN